MADETFTSSHRNHRPRKNGDNGKTTQIMTTLYDLIEAIGEETTTQEEYLIYLAVDNLVHTGRLKWCAS